MAFNWNFWKKKKLPQKELTQTFPFVVDNELLQSIITQYRMPFIEDTGAPWRANNDWEYLDKIWASPGISRFLLLKRVLATSTKWRMNWDLVKECKRMQKPIDKIGAEEYTRHLLSPKHFNLRWFLKVTFRSLVSGMEAADLNLKRLGKDIVPTETKHIDNRLWKRFRYEDEKGVRFVMGFRNGVEMKARSLTPDEKRNCLLMIHEPWMRTFGTGYGIAYPLYFLWRFRSFVDELIQICAEKWSIPWLAVSMDADAAVKFGGSLAGADIQSLLSNYMEKFFEMKAGGYFALPVPANISILDAGKGKIEELTKLLEYLDRLAGDVVLGASGTVLGSAGTYGAMKAQSVLGMRFLQEDREYFDYQMNVLLKRIYEVNKESYARFGIKNWYDMPQFEFVYHEIDPETIIEIQNVLNKSGYEIDDKVIEEIMGVELKKDENGNVIKHQEIENLGDNNMNDKSAYKGDGKEEFEGESEGGDTKAPQDDTGKHWVTVNGRHIQVDGEGKPVEQGSGGESQQQGSENGGQSEGDTQQQDTQQESQQQGNEQQSQQQQEKPVKEKVVDYIVNKKQEIQAESSRIFEQMQTENLSGRQEMMDRLNELSAERLDGMETELQQSQNSYEEAIKQEIGQQQAMGAGGEPAGMEQPEPKYSEDEISSNTDVVRENVDKLDNMGDAAIKDIGEKVGLNLEGDKESMINEIKTTLDGGEVKEDINDYFAEPEPSPEAEESVESTEDVTPEPKTDEGETDDSGGETNWEEKTQSNNDEYGRPYKDGDEAVEHLSTMSKTEVKTIGEDMGVEMGNKSKGIMIEKIQAMANHLRGAELEEAVGNTQKLSNEAKSEKKSK